MPRFVWFAIICLMLTGCAYGRKVDYAHSFPSVPNLPPQSVEVRVTDARPYVVSGNKKGTFVGLIRGSYYIPYDVNTRSGRPLASDLQAALVGGFERHGLAARVAEVGAKSASKPGVLLLDVSIQQWKSEAAIGEILTYSLRAELIDQTGQQLAVAHARGSDRIYDYTQAGRNALASLLAQPTVVQALGGDVVIDAAQGEPVQSEPVRKAAAELFIPRFGRDGVY
ncbi:MAG: hypothetical protein E2594_05590 [Pseudomonas sp.]|nr:hypothetical protein [Pseudomonas sp.]